MGYKSRDNFKTGVCFDTCKARCCNPDKEMTGEREVYKLSGSKDTRASHVVVKETTGSDGSKLDAPMSKTYIDHIRSRSGESIKKMKPNMGAYGA